MPFSFLRKRPRKGEEPDKPEAPSEVSVGDTLDPSASDQDPYWLPAWERTGSSDEPTDEGGSRGTQEAASQAPDAADDIETLLARSASFVRGRDSEADSDDAAFSGDTDLGLETASPDRPDRLSEPVDVYERGAPGTATVDAADVEEDADTAALVDETIVEEEGEAAAIDETTSEQEAEPATVADETSVEVDAGAAGEVDRESIDEEADGVALVDETSVDEEIDGKLLTGIGAKPVDRSDVELSNPPAVSAELWEELWERSSGADSDGRVPLTGEPAVVRETAGARDAARGDASEATGGPTLAERRDEPPDDDTLEDDTGGPDTGGPDTFGVGEPGEILDAESPEALSPGEGSEDAFEAEAPPDPSRGRRSRKLFGSLFSRKKRRGESPREEFVGSDGESIPEEAPSSAEPSDELEAAAPADLSPDSLDEEASVLDGDASAAAGLLEQTPPRPFVVPRLGAPAEDQNLPDRAIDLDLSGTGQTVGLDSGGTGRAIDLDSAEPGRVVDLDSVRAGELVESDESAAQAEAVEGDDERAVEGDETQAVEAEDEDAASDAAPSRSPFARLVRKEQLGKLGTVWRANSVGRVAVLSIVTYVVAVNLAYFLLLRPGSERLDVLEDRKVIIHDFTVLRESGAAIAAFRDGLMDGDQRLTVLSEVSAMAESVGATIIGDPELLPLRSTSKLVTEYPVRMRVRGTYREINELVWHLERSARFIRVEEVEIVSDEGSTGTNSEATLVLAVPSWEE